MRNYTAKVIGSLRFTGTFRLNPFPGAYPTRVVVLKEGMLKADVKGVESRVPGDYESFKILYCGKPNTIALKKYVLKPRFLNFLHYFEFDRKNLVYGFYYNELGPMIKTTKAFEFYHAYVAQGENAWPWFLEAWRPLRVGQFTAYNHFPIQDGRHLKDALERLLVAYKRLEPVKNVNL